ncbi:AbrB/MazE/SpoVT family DNA-binding domain-containing protein [Polymorphobacter sp. PAMC 29334]|uniref:antitoxin n=1 Tax=Polymorphobacter sp. PAMC 29334 TaxID=2862331 RepID=UPI001C75CF51|nr:AbrB/MazE/SpoVT family DNA-binding domain-containing protein [Polymorphobacter sp. PAMC 29334]QYE34776.1 AbrB/MazE/SpoVT family DNA-binding domain-containing protein [Polymorphobacter sp. PAMC 29334]
MTATVRSKVFRSGNSVAVRLPKAFGLEEGAEVEIERLGRQVVIRQVFDAAEEKAKLTAFIAELRSLPAPGVLEIRDTDEIPERPNM